MEDGRVGTKDRAGSGIGHFALRTILMRPDRNRCIRHLKTVDQKLIQFEIG